MRLTLLVMTEDAYAISIGTKIDDLVLELLYVRIFGEFCGISQIWEATIAKRMSGTALNPVNVLFSRL